MADITLTFADLAAKRGLTKKSEAGGVETINDILKNVVKIMDGAKDLTKNSGAVLGKLQVAPNVQAASASPPTPAPTFAGNGGHEPDKAVKDTLPAKPRLTGAKLIDYALAQIDVAAANHPSGENMTLKDVKILLPLARTQVEAAIDEELKKWSL